MEAIVHKNTDEKILSLLSKQQSVNAGFKLLMDAYQERLYWHIRRMVLDHDDANDVLQNTFVKVFRNHHSFKGNSKLYTWLYRIATNETLTHLQRKQKRATGSLDDQMRELKADHFFEADAIQEKLQRALLALPPKQKAVFQLRYYDEMNYQDISEILNTSVGALKASYHHAAKKIETFFNENE